jgi:hypothetical protein
VINRVDLLKTPQLRHRKVEFDKHARNVDPRFVDPDREDLRLKADSLAFSVGFRPLDLAAMEPRTPPVDPQTHPGPQPQGRIPRSSSCP